MFTVDRRTDRGGVWVLKQTTVDIRLGLELCPGSCRVSLRSENQFRRATLAVPQPCRPHTASLDGLNTKTRDRLRLSPSSSPLLGWYQYQEGTRCHALLARCLLLGVLGPPPPPNIAVGCEPADDLPVCLPVGLVPTLGSNT